MQMGAVQSYSYGTGGAEVNVPLADDMGNVRALKGSTYE
jgi:hypothetical protein